MIFVLTCGTISSEIDLYKFEEENNIKKHIAYVKSIFSSYISVNVIFCGIVCDLKVLNGMYLVIRRYNEYISIEMCSVEM